MSNPHEELLQIADRLENLSQNATAAEAKEPLEQLEEAAISIGKAWSSSCFGYHARIYYKDLKSPPPGAHFSPEWGMQDSWPIKATTGNWIEYNPDEVERAIWVIAGSPDLGPAQQLAAHAESAFQSNKSDVLSILTTALLEQEDSFVASLKEQVEQIAVLSREQVLRRCMPSGQLRSRDSLAVTQDLQAPPHLSVLSEVIALKQAPAAWRDANSLSIGRQWLRKNCDVFVPTGVSDTIDFSIVSRPILASNRGDHDTQLNRLGSLNYGTPSTPP